MGVFAMSLGEFMMHSPGYITEYPMTDEHTDDKFVTHGLFIVGILSGSKSPTCDHFSDTLLPSSAFAHPRQNTYSGAKPYAATHGPEYVKLLQGLLLNPDPRGNAQMSEGKMHYGESSVPNSKLHRARDNIAHRLGAERHEIARGR